MSWFGLLSIFLISCTTIVGRDLPVINIPIFTPSEKPSLVVFSPWTKYMMKASDLKDYFLSLNLFKKVDVLDEYSFVTNETMALYDLSLEFNFGSGGFFEPYCLLTLVILPCTPPISLALGAKVGGRNANANRTYLFKEEATKIVWALGPLVPGFGRDEVKVKELQVNMLNHLISKLFEDKLIH
ncbi:MAG: hypothetical protein HYV97_18750 [Bdellovibrio sp.]|nr:hypothetical protein [Bdellovibrio sp.]